MQLPQICISVGLMCLFIPLWECTLVREEDLCVLPRTKLFMDFVSRMEWALQSNSEALLILNVQPLNDDSMESKTICKEEKSQFFGFWTNNGQNLCLVVRPERQVLWKAKCCGESCCGSSTRCVPQYRNFAPLLFCSRFIWVPGDGNDDSFSPSPVAKVLDEDDADAAGVNGFIVYIDLKLPVSCACQKKCCAWKPLD